VGGSRCLVEWRVVASLGVMCRIDFFILVRFLKKKYSESVSNEFGSVQFEKTAFQFGYIIVIYYLCNS